MSRRDGDADGAHRLIRRVTSPHLHNGVDYETGRDSTKVKTHALYKPHGARHRGTGADLSDVPAPATA